MPRLVRSLALPFAVLASVALAAPLAAQDAPPAEAATETTPATAALRIVSTPSGAAVTINGRRVGVTPVELTMPVGTSVEVILELADHAPWSDTVVVDAESGATVEAELVAGTGEESSDGAAPE